MFPSPGLEVKPYHPFGVQNLGQNSGDFPVKTISGHAHVYTLMCKARICPNSDVESITKQLQASPVTQLFPSNFDPQNPKASKSAKQQIQVRIANARGPPIYMFLPCLGLGDSRSLALSLHS